MYIILLIFQVFILVLSIFSGRGKSLKFKYDWYKSNVYSSFLITMHRTITRVNLSKISGTEDLYFANIGSTIYTIIKVRFQLEFYGFSLLTLPDDLTNYTI